MRVFRKQSRAILTVSEVSKYLRIHRTTLYRLLKTRQVPAFKIGNDWRISAEAMDSWLTEMEGRETRATIAETTKASDRSSARRGSDGKANGQKLRF
jgi:excisionase family DNA binding protein